MQYSKKKTIFLNVIMRVNIIHWICFNYVFRKGKALGLLRQDLGCNCCISFLHRTRTCTWICHVHLWHSQINEQCFQIWNLASDGPCLRRKNWQPVFLNEKILCDCYVVLETKTGYKQYKISMKIPLHS